MICVKLHLHSKHLFLKYQVRKDLTEKEGDDETKKTAGILESSKSRSSDRNGLELCVLCKVHKGQTWDPVNPPRCKVWKLLGDSEGKCVCLKKEREARKYPLTIFVFFKGSAEKSFRSSQHLGTLGQN